MRWLCPPFLHSSFCLLPSPWGGFGLPSKKRTQKLCSTWLIGLAFKVNRAKVLEGAMETAPVIEGLDEVEDGLARFAASFEGTPIDQFLFERAPEGFHGGIVIAAGFATHGGEGLALRQSVAEVSAGVLAAAVGVEDQLGSRLGV